MLTITLPQLKREIRLVRMLAKIAKGEDEKMTELTLKGERYRIRRLDPRNLVIEQLKGKNSPTWDTVGFYGKLDDLTIGLLNRVVDLPEGDKLVEQIALLRAELREVYKAVEEQLKVGVEV